MSCYICGRGNCIPIFHSIEEQQAFSDAEDAYDNYIEVRDRCRREWVEAESEEDESEVE